MSFVFVLWPVAPYIVQPDLEKHRHRRLTRSFCGIQSNN